MIKKITALFNVGKLAKYVWFFGCMTIGIAAILGMARAYCRLWSGKEKCCLSGGAPDIRNAKKRANR